MAESNFTFRVDEKLKDEFISVAKSHDRPASQLLREFMRDYIQRRDEAAQHDAWFRERVEKSMADTRPAAPHGEAAGRTRAAIDRVVGKKGGREG